MDRIDESAAGRMAQLAVTWSAPFPAVGAETVALMPVQRGEAILLVPKSAIRVDGGRQFVEIVRGTTADHTEVTVGRLIGDDVEITSGVVEGERVLLRR